MRVTSVDDFEVSYLTSGLETRGVLEALRSKIESEFNKDHQASELEPDRLIEFQEGMKLYADFAEWARLVSEQLDELSKRVAYIYDATNKDNKK